MAGAGYKSWIDGDILTASDVNTYLMQQAVMVFADASARTSAIAAPSEGMVTYLSDNDLIEYYDGAAWVNVNDNTDAILKTIVDAKGDLIAGTAADTVDRLAVGTNGHVLTADSSTATGLKWAAPSAGSLTLISTASPSSVSTVTMDSVFSASYRNYMIVLTISGTVDEQMNFRFRTSGSDNSNANYNWQDFTASSTTLSGGRSASQTLGRIGTLTNGLYSTYTAHIYQPNLSLATTWNSSGVTNIGAYTTLSYQAFAGNFSAATAFDGIKVYSANNNNFSGKISIYGVSE